MLIAWIIYLVIPYPNNPSWESTDGGYTTGGVLIDVDMDGDLDLVVSNGNDMATQTNRCYKNTGNALPTTASWNSADRDYHGHCACGDIDNDGYPELAVSNYGSFAPNYDKLYRNQNGNFESSPSWHPTSTTNSFACAFGDVDNDGDLDLAFACGERYTSNPQRVKLFLNINGNISTTPSWESNVQSYFYDVEWVDIDNDGDLDLACAADGAPNLIYENIGGKLGSTPYWQSSDSQGTLEIAFGDFDSDGDLDMAAANNAQLGGESRLVLYRNLGTTLEQSPSWQSNDNRTYYSCCAFGDVDMDGDLDLAGGGWWEPVVVFENRNGNYNPTPDWSWSPPNNRDLVCEEIAFGDIDNRCSPTVNSESHPVAPDHRLIYLNHRYIRKIIRITHSGGNVNPSSYCYDHVNGWVSFDSIFSGPDTVRVTYRYSKDIDLLVTNWVNSRGNFYFLNEGPAIREVASKKHRLLPAIVLGPLSIPKEIGPYRLFDISGRLICRDRFDLIPLQTGVYFLKADGYHQKLVVIK
ncbi:hypothetical protein DRP53_01230 [candidate division WOR-3 bacterium]|uniref:VCBS repeat-containing protein n=1 Tax=candidate division WOR-3 bacterium TaxID=2052148 RepID=A0A660SKX9_UNCW3|nr:MAG: hypothetical protein DRP53_01230 [candidate division WOR-3 bacterium]